MRRAKSTPAAEVLQGLVRVGIESNLFECLI
jgi:hypothetical protein